MMYAEITLEILDVVAAVGISKRSIERLVARGEFPRPFYLGSSRKWKRIDIEDFINEANGSMRQFRELRRSERKTPDSPPKNS